MSISEPRTILKFSLVGIAFAALLAYAYLQGRDFIEGPQLTIISPKNGQTIASTSPLVALRGTAAHIAFLTVDGLQIYTDEKGSFSRALLLPTGYSIITVKAQDKFGRSITKEVQVVVQ